MHVVHGHSGTSVVESQQRGERWAGEWVETEGGYSRTAATLTSEHLEL